MSVVKLRIDQPVNGANFLGVNQITLKGELVELPPELVNINMYYRWYSSLFPAEENRYSINVNALNDPFIPYNAPLRIGTHILTLAAADQEMETKDAQNATQHGGVTGGEIGDEACIINIFNANIIKAASNDVEGQLKKSCSILEAEAPLQWGKLIESTDTFEPNPDYHNVNRIIYKWKFEPDGAPGGRNSAVLIPDLDDLTFGFDESETIPLVQYNDRLPDELDTGSYILTLRVEHKDNSDVGHETSMIITILE